MSVLTPVETSNGAVEKMLGGASAARVQKVALLKNFNEKSL